MTRVFLVRHGETDWNRERRWQGHHDVPLNQQGHLQARSLARKWTETGFRADALIASDLLRARETAAALGPALGVAPLWSPSWREFDVGSWAGLTRCEIALHHAGEWDRILAGEDLPRGGGETLAGAFRRVAAAMELAVADHAGRAVVVVTHGGVIRLALLHVLGWPPGRMAEVPVVPNSTVLELEHRGTWSRDTAAIRTILGETPPEGQGTPR